MSFSTYNMQYDEPFHVYIIRGMLSLYTNYYIGRKSTICDTRKVEMLTFQRIDVRKCNVFTMDLERFDFLSIVHREVFEFRKTFFEIVQLLHWVYNEGFLVDVKKKSNCWKIYILKGTVAWDFWTLVFFMNRMYLGSRLKS